MHMPRPRLNEKHLREINLEDWQRDDSAIAEELKIVGKIMRRDISLSTMEALMHDALQYRRHYDLAIIEEEERFNE